MASTDDELITEIRALTGYGTGTISDEDMQSLVAVAKDEILDVVDTDTLDWYNDRSAERALYWLVALFTKVRTGEVGGAGFSLGELEQAPLLGTTQFWLAQFYRHLQQIGDYQAFGVSSIARNDRTYGSNVTSSDTNELL